MSTPSRSTSTSPDAATPEKTPVPPIEISVDATTLMTIVVALLIVPLLLSGFLFQ
jgi:hypothetical protein